MSGIVHKSAFCGERGALVQGLNPRPVLLCKIAQVAVPCPLWSPQLYSSYLFLLTYIPLKGCYFQKCCKAMSYFWNLTQLHWKKWSVWCLYTYVLMLISVTWNIVFFIKIPWSHSYSSCYAQICLIIICTAGRENLQNWSQLWFKLFILV